MNASALLRREDERLLTGQAQYVHNLDLPGMRYAAFVRSTHANAQIAWDSTQQRFPDSVAVLNADSIGEWTLPPPNQLLPMQGVADDLVLPTKVAQYVGQPLAIVVASSPAGARAAADTAAACVHYQALRTSAPEPTFRAHFARAPSAPHTMDEHPVTVSIAHQQARVQAFAMEPRASVAQWEDDSLTFWTGTQAPARARDMLAAVLKVPTAQVRVIAPDVGGAFGAKASLYPEDFVLALAARHLRCAVKWCATRSEEFLSATHGRGATLSASLEVDGAGRLQRLDAQMTFPLGAWLPYSAAVPLRNAARILPGPYVLPHLHISGTASRSHEAAINIYRGAGRPEAALVIESLIERAARALKMDPIELRRRNVIASQSMPYQTGTGETIDSGGYEELLNAASTAFEYERARSEQITRRASGERVGIGCALYVEPCGQGHEWARVTLHADGTVQVHCGSPGQGQGHETTFAQIAAKALHVPTAQVQVTLGDTHTAPYGTGALASRSTAIGGSAIAQACARALALKRENAPYPIVVEETYTTSLEAWGAGCVLVQLVIDGETGVPTIERIVWVDDAGTLICPALAKGQLVGGMAQGIGQALFEAIRYDNNGQLLTGSLMDYAVARASDVPKVQISSRNTPTKANLLGAKGVGEAGCIGVPAAILNAVCDALPEFDTAHLDFPITSEKLWSILWKAPMQ